MAHWWALKRVLSNVKGTVDYGIDYKRPGSKDQSKTLWSIDFPRGYVDLKSPLEVVGLQPLDYTDNVDSDYAN